MSAWKSSFSNPSLTPYIFLTYTRHSSAPSKQPCHVLLALKVLLPQSRSQEMHVLTFLCSAKHDSGFQQCNCLSEHALLDSSPLG